MGLRSGAGRGVWSKNGLLSALLANLLRLQTSDKRPYVAYARKCSAWGAIVRDRALTICSPLSLRWGGAGRPPPTPPERGFRLDSLSHPT